MSEARGLRRIALFGGGSGGHLHPGLAVVEAARRSWPELEAVFFQSGRAIERRVLEAQGVETAPLPLTVPRGVRGWARYAWQASRARASLRPVLRDGVDAVIGLGGYVSFPGILAARDVGIPVVLLEQNRVPGKVNRLGARFASVVACSDEDAARAIGRRGAGRAVVTGNPLRAAVCEAARRRQERSARGYERTVVIVGGSQGASALNRAVLGATEALGPARGRIRWVHLTGDRDEASVREAWGATGHSADARAFAADLPDLFARADLVISRAGGTTLAELAAVGVPAVLVPYPHHGDRHQVVNAEAFAREGAALLIEEDRLEPRALGELLAEVLFDDARLDHMEARARRLGRPDAADRVLDLLEELCETCRRDSVSSS